MPRKKKSLNVPPAVIYEVCKRFLRNEKTPEIAKWLQSEGYSVNREQIFPLVRKGIDLDFLRLCPPANEQMEQRLKDTFDLGNSPVRVVNVERDEMTRSAMSEAAAEIIFELTKDVAEKKRKEAKDAAKGDRSDGRNVSVHIGLGAGATCRSLAEKLGRLYRSESGLPHLTIHALSSGFDEDRPETAPFTFVSYFRDGSTRAPKFVSLLAPTFVPTENYKRELKNPGIRTAFDKKNEIDIVLTSMGHASGEHGVFHQFFEDSPEVLEELYAKDWCGDVQLRPFSPYGAIRDTTQYTSVTLFELDELVKLAKTDGKHVVLLAGPCSSPNCPVGKETALKPLLDANVPSLRVWSHLVVDKTAALNLLD